MWLCNNFFLSKFSHNAFSSSWSSQVITLRSIQLLMTFWNCNLLSFPTDLAIGGYHPLQLPMILPTTFFTDANRISLSLLMAQATERKPMLLTNTISRAGVMKYRNSLLYLEHYQPLTILCSRRQQKSSLGIIRCPNTCPISDIDKGRYVHK